MEADQITSRSAAWRAFIGQAAPRLLLTVASIAVVVRLWMGQWHLADGLVVLLTVAMIGPFEWIVHRHLLHAPSTSFRARRLGTGTGHREHHRDPNDLRWLLLSRRDVVAFAVGIGLLTFAWAAPMAIAVGGSPPLAALSGWTIGLFALVHYEWTHLLIHTRYRLRSRYYRALARHHRLHHYRNERYWLGVTTRTGDRLAGTMPERGEVPLSATARTLGRDRADVDELAR